MTCPVQCCISDMCLPCETEIMMSFFQNSITAFITLLFLSSGWSAPVGDQELKNVEERHHEPHNFLTSGEDRGQVEAGEQEAQVAEREQEEGPEQDENPETLK